jgi:hypothetical protein
MYTHRYEASRSQPLLEIAGYAIAALTLAILVVAPVAMSSRFPELIGPVVIDGGVAAKAPEVVPKVEPEPGTVSCRPASVARDQAG